ncbi:MAG: GrpB family protein [Chloroflexota bacterium]|nr:GrpB family protein [Chloroflexota bacterium]
MTGDSNDPSLPHAPQAPLVVDYNPTWPDLFAEAKAQILQAVAAHIQTVHHVGSTSVPGLAAKPIIDILVGVHDWTEARVTIPPLERIGWEFRGPRGIPRRHYFVIRLPDGRRTHHLHMLETTSTPYADMLAFRNHLRTHPTAATQYATLKRQQASRPEPHPGAYQQSKAPFIQRILCEIRSTPLSRERTYRY